MAESFIGSIQVLRGQEEMEKEKIWLKFFEKKVFKGKGIGDISRRIL